MNETLNTVAVAFLIWLPAIITTAYYVGVHIERVRWNKLIRLGALPKPRTTPRRGW